MADAVSDLNEFVKTSGVTYLQNQLMSENVVYAAWAVPIQKSTTHLAKSPNESVALSIQRELNLIPQQDLNTWTPKKGTAYPSRSTVQQKIKSCMVHVQKVIDYCTAIKSVISILGIIIDCELSTELVNLAFSKDTAFKICRGLGATTKRHLLYVNKAAVDGLNIKPNEKKTMWRTTEEYQREYTDNNGVTLTPNAKALANMKGMINRL
jgi:hypothetical protein